MGYLFIMSGSFTLMQLESYYKLRIEDNVQNYDILDISKADVYQIKVLIIYECMNFICLKRLQLNLSQQLMSYFQKYQKICGNSRTTNHTNQSAYLQNISAAETRKNSESRQSYLKAFKKYYIDKLMDKNNMNRHPQKFLANKQNFCFHQPQHRHQNSIISHEKSTKQMQSGRQYGISERQYNGNERQERQGVVNERQSILNERHPAGNERHFAINQKRNSVQGIYPKISRSKMVALVNNNDSQLQELIYNSISQMQREMMSFGENNDLMRQNKMLKNSVQKMKQILKEKLKDALKKNKEQLTLMFDEYSSMIKKLLEDKEKLTNNLQLLQNKVKNQEKSKKTMQDQYQNKIRIIVEQNKAQVTNTKQQIQEFLDMIIQYQQQANAEKLELQKLREKVVQLQMENDQLKGQVSSFRDSETHSMSQLFHQATQEQETQSIDRNDSSSDVVQIQIQKYTEKIQRLLMILDRLQEQNKQLNQFLKMCKCSRITGSQIEKSNISQNSNIEQTIKGYQKKLIDAEKQYIREETMLRQVIRKKDQCIQRLNMVIVEMRKQRYESVDRVTEEAVIKRIHRQK